jgi:hypothetical protein
LQKGGIPLFGKEGLGEILGGICLFNYGLLSKIGLIGEVFSILIGREEILFPALMVGAIRTSLDFSRVWGTCETLMYAPSPLTKINQGRGEGG